MEDTNVIGGEKRVNVLETTIKKWVIECSLGGEKRVNVLETTIKKMSYRV